MPAAAGVTYMIEERRERIQAIMAQNDIGIDLGTTTIIIAQEGKGVVLNQPTLLFGSLLARLYKHIHIYSEKVKNRAYYYKEMKNRVEITLFAAYAVENDSECICYTA